MKLVATIRDCYIKYGYLAYAAFKIQYIFEIAEGNT